MVVFVVCEMRITRDILEDIEEPDSNSKSAKGSRLYHLRLPWVACQMPETTIASTCFPPAIQGDTHVRLDRVRFKALLSGCS